ncbi:uncharacterized protein LOC105663339 isoform X1 [Megachile rotundata]|uniref:uncharacterized protein LOC105663339 isoform X1 n=1 Tax=Megachile rotundata TaxID=143995 RepID=UPI003FD663C4
MADAKSKKARSTAKPAPSGIPLPRGKENARPSLSAAEKRASFAKEPAGRTRVSIDCATDRSAQTSRAFADVTKKAPFKIHCDQKNVPREESREESRPRNRATSEVAAEATRKRSTVDKTDDSRLDKNLPRSKIPRRSRSCSVPTESVLSKRPTLDPRSRLVEIDRTVVTLKRKLSEETSSRCPNERNETRAKKCGETCPTLCDGRVASPIPAEPVIQEEPVDKIRRTDLAKNLGRSGDRASLPVELLFHAEYLEDLPIIEQQREERSVRLSVNFLRGNVNAEQRRLVIIFMISVGVHCRYPSFAVYQAVKLFDAALDRIPMQTPVVQLHALASLWIALKKQEHFHRIPTAAKMVNLAKELYQDREDLLIACEAKILQALDFNLTFADPFSLFNYHLINCQRCLNISEESVMFLYNCGGYLIDVTLLDEQFCRKGAGLIAATAAELALGLAFDAIVDNARPRWLFWRGLLSANVPRLIAKYRDEEIDRSRVTMLRRVLISGKKRYGFDAVHKKYSRSRHGRISERLLDRASRVSPSESLFDL